MKIFYALFYISFVFSLQAQECPETDRIIVFSAQHEIDSFPSRYPLCRDFTQSLVIEEAEVGAITNLDSLRQLERIVGDLWISENAKLPHLYGLHQLAHIGGSLEITRNALLSDLSGLDSLKNLGSGLYIAVNSSLKSLVGLNQLFKIGGQLQIVNNERLISLSGLENLEEVGALSMLGNDLLRHPEGLERLTEINGDLSISHTSFTDVFNLSGVRRINGVLAIDHNDILRSLSGLDSIDYNSISELYVTDNDNLSLCAVSSICEYLAAGKPGHVAWNGTTGCDNIMEVQDACNTRPITPNSNCFSNGVTFSTQDQIDNFPVNYPTCRRFLWHVSIEETVPGNIINLDSLGQIKYIGGTLTIQNNRDLANLTGLDSVPSIGRNLVIQNNAALLNFNGLGQVKSIGGHVSIIGNDALKNCAGLDSLTSINGSLVMKQNASLESLRGLDQIDYLTIENIAIDGSPFLSACAIQSICDFLDFRRGAQITRNAEGCNSAEEVKVLCTTTTSNTGKDASLHSFSIYPNPASSKVQFDFQLQRAAHLTISIYDYLGRQVAEVYNGLSKHGKKIYSWDISTLNPGLYFSRIQVGSITKEKRLMILR